MWAPERHHIHLAIAPSPWSPSSQADAPRSFALLPGTSQMKQSNWHRVQRRLHPLLPVWSPAKSGHHGHPSASPSTHVSPRWARRPFPLILRRVSTVYSPFHIWLVLAMYMLSMDLSSRAPSRSSSPTTLRWVPSPAPPRSTSSLQRGSFASLPWTRHLPGRLPSLAACSQFRPPLCPTNCSALQFQIQFRQVKQPLRYNIKHLFLFSSNLNE
jgi:hypothetical protein